MLHTISLTIRSWRGRMQATVHSLPFQVFILSLVVLDALIVLFELLLDVGAFGELSCSFFMYCTEYLVVWPIKLAPKQGQGYGLLSTVCGFVFQLPNLGSSKLKRPVSLGVRVPCLLSRLENHIQDTKNQCRY